MNCYKILTLLLVSALIISPAAGAVGSGAEEESTWWDTTKDYAAYAWETVKEHPYQVMIGTTALLATGAGLYWYDGYKIAAAQAARENWEISQMERLVNSLIDPSQQPRVSKIFLCWRALAL